MLIKKRDNFSTNQSKEKIQSKIKTLENALVKLNEEKEELEAKIENIKKKADDNYQNKVAIFKKTIRPLEDSRKLVIEEKDTMSDKISTSEDKIANLHKEIATVKQELQKQKELKTEHIKVKIGLHKRMDEYKENYPDELQLFYEEEKNKEEIRQLKEKQKTLKAQLKEANSQREVVREEIVKLDDRVTQFQDDYDVILDNLKTATKVGESEIVKMESFINRNAMEYDAPSLTSLIDQVCQDRYCYSTSNKVLANHIKIVERMSEEMTIQYNEKIDSIKEEIIELKNSINSLKPKVKMIDQIPRSEKSTEDLQRESQVISKFKAKVGNLKQCLETLRSTKLEYKCRHEVFDKWILKKKAFLSREDSGNISNSELCNSELDNSILEAFLKNTLYKIEDFGSKKKLEEMLGFYVDKVARREKAIQKCYVDSLEVKKLLDDTRKNLKNVQIPDQEYHTIKNQLKQATLREKAIELLIEERRAQLEFEILKQGEENFEIYLESNSEVFTNVKKTYGNKISEKMKNEQKQEFIDMIRDQYQKRYDEIKTTHYQILDVDKKLDECDRLINDELPAQQRRAEEDKSNLEDRLISMKQQLSAFVTAENECIDIIEELLEQKKEEIYHQNNEIYRDNNFENIKSRLQEVKDTILAKERAIEKNHNVIEETDACMFDRNTKYSAEEAQMRTRLDNLKLGEREIKQTVKPQLFNLKREIKELNHEIVNGKKKMEGIEDKIQKCLQGLELAKDAYIEKFNLDPDEITGSPVKKTQFEYTKEYEKLKNMEFEDFKMDDDYENGDYEEEGRDEVVDIEEEVAQHPSPPKKKKIESVSLDLSELINMNMKARQEEARQEEEDENDIVHISLMNNPTKLKVNINGLSDKDIEFLESIRPLLEGKEVFKKFSNTSSISQIPFNPYENKKPERCGFGRRLLRLNPESIDQVFIVNRMDIRKNGYYIEKRGMHSN